MEWRVIEEAPFYMVSDEGHVKSCKRHIPIWNGYANCIRTVPEVYPLKEKDIRGYKNVSLVQYDENMVSTKRYMGQVHRLVLEAFKPVENMKSLQVNHINGDKGDNRLENLEWCTCQENVTHAIRVLGHKRDQNGEKNSMSKLTENQVIDIIKMCLNSELKISDQKIADMYGVTRRTINHIKLGQSWKHIDRSLYIEG